MKVPAVETILELYALLSRVAEKTCNCDSPGERSPDPEIHAGYCEYRHLANGTQPP
jgi:hypothetical protein